MTILEIMMGCFLVNTFFFSSSGDPEDPMNIRTHHWIIFGFMLLLLLLLDLIHRSHYIPG